MERGAGRWFGGPESEDSDRGDAAFKTPLQRLLQRASSLRVTCGHIFSSPSGVPAIALKLRRRGELRAHHP